MTKTLRDWIPEYIHTISPYVPGKPIEEVERELKITAVKLASNENPLGPSPLAVEAVKKALAECHRYPDGGGFYLREKLSKRHNIPIENIGLGNGTSELIDLAARLLLRGGEEAISSEGSFPLYYITVLSVGGKLTRVPLRDYGFDLEAIAKAVTPRTRIIYLSNPNNPTGTYFTADDLEKFLDRIPADVLVVLDEAYCDYVEASNYSRSLELVRHGANVLVLRTFSKVYGLAGIRIGYGMGPREIIVEIDKFRAPFNTSGVAQAAALAALDDTAHVQRSLDSNRAGLKQITSGLQRMGIRFVPSVCNFVLIELGVDGQAVADELLHQGVIVRPMRWMGFPNAIRVSVGTAEENEKFLQGLSRSNALAPGAPAGVRGRASD